MSSDRKIRKLGSLDTRGVSLVDRGANRKRIAIAKEQGVSIAKLLVDIIEKGEMTDESEFEKACKAMGFDEARTETCKAIAKMAGAYKDDPTVKKFLAKMFGESDEDEDDVTKTKKSLTDKGNDGEGDKTVAEQTKEEIEKAEAAKAEAIKTEVEKQVAEKLEAVTKSQEAVIKSMQESLQKAEDARRKQEWLSKAEKELAFVPGQTTEQLAEMLSTLDKDNSKLAESQFSILKGVSASMQAVTKQRGFSGQTPYKGAAENDAWQEIMKSATGSEQAEVVKGYVEIVKGFDHIKNTRNRVTKAQQIQKAAEYEAVSEYLLAHPEAYDAYLRDHPEQTTRGPSRN